MPPVTLPAPSQAEDDSLVGIAQRYLAPVAPAPAPASPTMADEVMREQAQQRFPELMTAPRPKPAAPPTLDTDDDLRSIVQQFQPGLARRAVRAAIDLPFPAPGKGQTTPETTTRPALRSSLDPFDLTGVVKQYLAPQEPTRREGAATPRLQQERIDLSPHLKMMARKRQLTEMIDEMSYQIGVHPALIHAMVEKESAYDSAAVNPKSGAAGLLQLMPETAKALGVKDPLDPMENLRWGIQYIKEQIQAHKGDLSLALASYNAGPGRVREYGGVPPFKETRDYIDFVLKRFGDTWPVLATVVPKEAWERNRRFGGGFVPIPLPAELEKQAQLVKEAQERGETPPKAPWKLPSAVIGAPRIPVFAEERAKMPPIDKARSSFNAGLGSLLSTVGSVGKLMGLEAWGKQSHDEGEAIAERYRVPRGEFELGNLGTIEPYVTTLPETLPSSLALLPVAFLGGYAGAGAAAKVGLGAFWQTFFGVMGGAGLSRVAESSMEAAGTYEEMRKKGRTDAEARTAASTTFWGNLPFAVMDAGEIALLIFPWLRRAPSEVRSAIGTAIKGSLGVAGGALMEGGEEAVQDSIQRWAQGDPVAFDSAMKEAVAMGTISGFLLQGGSSGLRLMRDAVRQKLPADMQQQFTQAYNQARQQGLDDEAAQNAAMDAVTHSVQGNAVVRAAIEAIRQDPAAAIDQARVVFEESGKAFQGYPQAPITPAEELHIANVLLGRAGQPLLPVPEPTVAMPSTTPEMPFAEPSVPPTPWPTVSLPIGDTVARNGAPWPRKAQAEFALHHRSDVSPETHAVVEIPGAGWIIRRKDLAVVPSAPPPVSPGPTGQPEAVAPAVPLPVPEFPAGQPTIAPTTQGFQPGITPIEPSREQGMTRLQASFPRLPGMGTTPTASAPTMAKTEATPPTPVEPPTMAPPPEEIATREEQRAAVNPEPTPAQMESGTYTKGHLQWEGLDLTIETPKGGTRRAKDGSWVVENFPADYGYVRRTEGADGDQVDVYIGDNLSTAPQVFVVDQLDVDTGVFDEHKVMLGFATQEEALATYHRGFSDGRAAERLGGVMPLSVEVFKDWLRDGDTTRPLSTRSPVPEVEAPPEVIPPEVPLQATKTPERITIAFPSMPQVTVRNALKRDGFQWDGKRKLWSARWTAIREQVADDAAKVGKGNVELVMPPRAPAVLPAPGAPEAPTETSAQTSTLPTLPVVVPEARMAMSEEAVLPETPERQRLETSTTAHLGAMSDEEFAAILDDADARLTTASPPPSPTISPTVTSRRQLQRRPTGPPRVQESMADKAQALGVPVTPEDLALFQREFGESGAVDEPEASYGAPLPDGVQLDKYNRVEPAFRRTLAALEAQNGTVVDFVTKMYQLFGTPIRPYLMHFHRVIREEITRGRPTDSGLESDVRSGPPTLEGAPPDDVQGSSEGGDIASANQPPRTADAGDGAGDAQSGRRRGRRPRAGTGRSVSPRGRRSGGAGNGTSITRANNKPGKDYVIGDPQSLVPGGAKDRYQRNVAAIRLLKTLEAEGRVATPDEQDILARFTSWGAISQVFSKQLDAPEGSLNYKYMSDSLKQWYREHQELKALLTPEEYAAAEATTPNAHYTSPEVIRQIYTLVEHLGFRKGRILEPSLGVGNFFGAMPDRMRSGSILTGIELDPVTARIAKQLYQSADIRAQGFEEAMLSDNFYDLAVSNVPFGNYTVHDPRYNKLKFSIHNYFFAKALDAVRPGGLVVFITSPFTMDSNSTTTREYIAERAKLVGAIRLPSKTFQGIAGTQVTTDIVILQKRDPSAPATSEEAFVGLGSLQAPHATSLRVNTYYVRHPEMLLGTMQQTNTQYATLSAELVAYDNRDLSEDISRAVQHLPADIYTESRTGRTTEPEAERTLLEGRPPLQGTILVENGQVRMVQGQSLITKPGIGPKVVERIKGLIAIREAFRSLRQLELADAAAEEIAQARQELNRAYDKHVAAHGFLSGPSIVNRQAFREDPSWPQLLSLEHYDARTKTATKARIFTERTALAQTKPAHVDNPQDALMASLAWNGRIDWDDMATMAGQSVEDLQSALVGFAFQNPNGGEWETADSYLTGDVRGKLKEAQAAAAADQRFQANVDALNVVQPPNLTIEQLDVRLGVSWIPLDVYTAFFAETLNISPQNLRLRHNPVVASWEVIVDQFARGTAANTEEWGVGDYYGHNVANAVMNFRQPKIFYTLDKQRVFDRAATLALHDKMARLQIAWKEWLLADPLRAQQLETIYNNEINRFVRRQADGSHLTLPGLAAEYTPYPHQKNAVWRAVQQGTLLFAHEVGAGKTLAMTATAMELRRLGLAKKPLILVPNSLINQWPLEILRFYPNANILAATKEDLAPQARQIFFGRIAVDDWDAVILPYSSFKFLPVGDDFFNEMIMKEIRKIDQIIEAEGGTGNKKNKTVKELAKARKELAAKLRRARNVEAQDRNITWEELGVDALFIDEFHNFKNLYFPTKMSNVAGMGTRGGSQRAFDMLTKMTYIQRLNNGRNVFAATGTPLSNSIAEAYTVQRYLQPQLLEALGMEHFDAWAAAFADTITRMEVAPTGAGFTARTSFSKFRNVPELLGMMAQVADVQTQTMLKLPRPPLIGGGPQLVVIPGSPQLKAYVQMLLKRAENLKNVDPKEDNMLKITSDGRKAALDIRLVLPGAQETPDNKVKAVAQRVGQFWRETTPDRGTQIIFLDIGTPQTRDTDETATESFVGEGEEPSTTPEESAEDATLRQSVYAEIRQKLLGEGIPEEEIAFIHDANTDVKRRTLFQQMNDGTIRVLVGSTGKMGEGMNVQRRLFAMHEIDVPWRPSDLTQRQGRILRPGNMYMERGVYIFRYITEGSFDAYMWQTVERKQMAFGRFLDGNSGDRSLDDIGNTQLRNAAEATAAASGNPLVMEKMQLESDIDRMQTVRTEYLNAQASSRREMALTIPASIGEFEERIEKLQELHNTFLAAQQSGTFEMRLKGKRYETPESAGEALLALWEDRANHSALETIIGEYFGSPVSVLKHADTVDSNGIVTTGDLEFSFRGNRIAITAKDPDPETTALRFNTPMEHIPQEVASIERRIDELRKRQTDIAELVNRPAPYTEELATAQARLVEVLALTNLDKTDVGDGLLDVDTPSDESDEDEGGDARRSQVDEDVAPYSNQPEDDFEKLFPRAGPTVDGRVVRAEIPNQSSIEATLDADTYRIMSGVRAVPMDALGPPPESFRLDARTQALADAIAASGEISPLIVVVDRNGPYILEGAHRIDALDSLGAKAFPAMVVLEDGARHLPSNATETAGEPEGGQYAQRPDATPESQQLAQQALGDLARARTRPISTARRGMVDRPRARQRGGAGVDIVYQRLPSDDYIDELRTTGRAAFVGQQAPTPHDIAVLAQAVRDPRIERLFWVFTRGDTVLAVDVVSSRLPASSQAFLTPQGPGASGTRHVATLRRRMQRMGADGYYLIHNHPSGRPTPSREDVALTQRLAQPVDTARTLQGVPGFRGHVVIDHGEYSIIDAQGQSSTHTIGKATSVTGSRPPVLDPFLAQPPRIHDQGLIVTGISSPDDIVKMAQSLQNPEGGVVLFFRSGKGEVRSIQVVPENLFRQVDALADYIRGQQRSVGGAEVFSHYQGVQSDIRDVGYRLYEQGVVRDHLTGMPSGMQVESLYGEEPRAFGRTRRREPLPGYRVAEEYPITVEMVEAIRSALASGEMTMDDLEGANGIFAEYPGLREALLVNQPPAPPNPITVLDGDAQELQAIRRALDLGMITPQEAETLVTPPDNLPPTPPPAALVVPPGATLSPVFQDFWQRNLVGEEPSLSERLAEPIRETWASVSRVYKELPRTDDFAVILHELLRLSKQRDIQLRQTVEDVNAFWKTMSPTQQTQFAQALYLRDLVEDAQRIVDDPTIPLRLPEGMTIPQVKQDLAILEQEIAQDAIVQSALASRARLLDQVTRQLIADAAAIGFDLSSRLSRTNYVRHQVRDMIHLKGVFGTGQRLKTPRGRGYQKQRVGGHDYNTQYVEPEVEVLTQMRVDSSIAKAIRVVREHYDIAPMLKAQAALQNRAQLERFLEGLATLAQERQPGFPQLTPDEMTEELSLYRETRSADFAGLAEDAYNDLLPDDGRWTRVIQALAAWHAVSERGNVSSPRVDPIVPRTVWREIPAYAAWMLQTAREHPATWDAAKIIAGTTRNAGVFAKEALGDERVTWKRLIPEEPGSPHIPPGYPQTGYVAWAPDPGNRFYFAYSIPDSAAMAVLRGTLDTMGLEADQIKRIMSIGTQQQEYVVPVEIAKTLDALVTLPKSHPLGRMSRRFLNFFKAHALLSPHRIGTTQVRNITGDVEAAFVGNMETFRYLPQAISDAFAYYKRGERRPLFAEWLSYGGQASTVQAQELDDLDTLNDHVVRQGTGGMGWAEWALKRIPVPYTPGWYWAARGAADFRESLLRYATFLSYRAQIAEHGSPRNYGASIRGEIDRLVRHDPGMAAYTMSNELILPYDETSPAGVTISRHGIPFWRYKEMNMKRFKRLLDNAVYDEKVASRVTSRLLGPRGAMIVKRSPFIGLRLAAFGVKAMGAIALLTFMNHWFFPEEERDLTVKQRGTVHAIFGRDEVTGRVIWFSRIGMLSDLLDWFGFDAWPEVLADFNAGRKNIPTLMRDYALRLPKEVGGQLITGLRPEVQLFSAGVLGKDLFPEPFAPRDVRDFGEYAARMFAVDPEYRALTGKPSPGYAKELFPISIGPVPIPKALVYTVDPGQSAYSDTRSLVQRFLIKNGEGGGYSVTASPARVALYNMKLALRYGDAPAVRSYMGEYVVASGARPQDAQKWAGWVLEGGEPPAYRDVVYTLRQGVGQSLRSLHPLARLNDQEKALFWSTLSREEQRKVMQAFDFYNTTLMGNVGGGRSTSTPPTLPAVGRP